MSNSTRREANEQYRFLLVNSAERAIVIWPHAQWLFVGPTPSRVLKNSFACHSERQRRISLLVL